MSAAFTDASSHTFYIPTEGKTLLLIDNTYAGTLTVTAAAGAYIGSKAATITVAQNYALVAIDLSGFKNKAYSHKSQRSLVIFDKPILPGSLIIKADDPSGNF